MKSDDETGHTSKQISTEELKLPTTTSNIIPADVPRDNNIDTPRRTISSWFSWGSKKKTPATSALPANNDLHKNEDQSTVHSDVVSSPLKEAAEPVDHSLNHVVDELHKVHPAGDNEGVLLWPLIKSYVDFVTVVAHLQHIVNPHPDSEMVMEKTVNSEAFLGELGEHHAMLRLSLSSVARNFIHLGGVDPSKLRLVVDPSELLPVSGVIDHEEFTMRSGEYRKRFDIRSHEYIKEAARRNDVELGSSVDSAYVEMRDDKVSGIHYSHAALYVTTMAPRHSAVAMLVAQYDAA